MAQKASKEANFLSGCLRAAIRVLSKARDLYIQSLTQCAGQMGPGAAMGCPTVHVSSLPATFTAVASSKSTHRHHRDDDDDDFAELVRAASIRSLGDKIESELPQRQPTAGKNSVVRRSRSLWIGRIDEDKACEFGEDISVNVDRAHIYHRSRSYAVSMRNNGTL